MVGTGQVVQAIAVTAPQQIISRTIPTLERRIDEAALAKPAAVDLVVSAVQIIDSAGLNWILMIQSRLESMGIRLRLVDPSSIMADALLATRLDARLPVELTGAAAGTAAGGARGS